MIAPETRADRAALLVGMLLGSACAIILDAVCEYCFQAPSAEAPAPEEYLERIAPPLLPSSALQAPHGPLPVPSSFADELIENAKANPDHAHLVVVHRIDGDGAPDPVEALFLPWRQQVAKVIARATASPGGRLPSAEEADAIVESFFRKTVGELQALPGLVQMELIPLRAEPTGSLATRD